MIRQWDMLLPRVLNEDFSGLHKSCLREVVFSDPSVHFIVEMNPSDLSEQFFRLSENIYKLVNK